MRLIPVLDIANGVVVRAVGGRRDEYRPVRSVLTDSDRPVEVAAAMLAATGANTLYVADLDAIRGRPANTLEFPVRTLLDAGFPVPVAKPRPNVVPVVGLETAAPPVTESSGESPGEHGNAFSFDLFDGRLWKNWEAWVGSADAILDLAGIVWALNFRTWIVLDVGRVGGGAGPGTELVVRQLRREFPGVELIAGGGVRGRDDVTRLADAGADGVLVASAVHDGTLTRG